MKKILKNTYLPTYCYGFILFFFIIISLFLYQNTLIILLKYSLYGTRWVHKEKAIYHQNISKI